MAIGKEVLEPEGVPIRPMESMVPGSDMPGKASNSTVTLAPVSSTVSIVASMVP